MYILVILYSKTETNSNTLSVKVLQLLVSWGSTWSVQTLTKKGSKNCVSYVRNDTTTYDIHQGHSQVFQEKTDQNQQLS